MGDMFGFIAYNSCIKGPLKKVPLQLFDHVINMNTYFSFDNTRQ